MADPPPRRDVLRIRELCGARPSWIASTPRTGVAVYGVCNTCAWPPACLCMSVMARARAALAAASGHMYMYIMYSV